MEDLEFEIKRLKVGDYSASPDGPLVVSKDHFQFTLGGNVHLKLKIPVNDITKCLAHFSAKKQQNFNYQRQIVNSDADVICLEVNQTCSKWVTKELNSALASVKSDTRVQLIPDGSRIATKYMVFCIEKVKQNLVEIFKEVFSPPGKSPTNKFRDLSTTGLNLILQDFENASSQEKKQSESAPVKSNNNQRSNMKLLCQTTIKPTPPVTSPSRPMVVPDDPEEVTPTAKSTVSTEVTKKPAAKPTVPTRGTKRVTHSDKADKLTTCKWKDSKAISNVLDGRYVTIPITRLTLSKSDLGKMTRKRVNEDTDVVSSPSKRVNIDLRAKTNSDTTLPRTSSRQKDTSKSPENFRSTCAKSNEGSKRNKQPIVVVSVEPVRPDHRTTLPKTPTPTSTPKTTTTSQDEKDQVTEATKADPNTEEAKPKMEKEEANPIVILDAGAFSVGPYKGIGLSSMELTAKDLRLYFSAQTPAARTLGSAMIIKTENIMHVLAHVSPMHTSVAFIFFSPPFLSVMCSYLQSHPEFEAYKKDDNFNSYGIFAIVLQPVGQSKCDKLKKVCRKIAKDRKLEGSILREIDAEGAGKYLKVCFSGALKDALATTDQKIGHTPCVKVENEDPVITATSNPASTSNTPQPSIQLNDAAPQNARDSTNSPQVQPRSITPQNARESTNSPQVQPRIIIPVSSTAAPQQLMKDSTAINNGVGQGDASSALVPVPAGPVITNVNASRPRFYVLPVTQTQSNSTTVPLAMPISPVVQSARPLSTLGQSVLQLSPLVQGARPFGAMGQSMTPLSPVVQSARPLGVMGIAPLNTLGQSVTPLSSPGQSVTPLSNMGQNLVTLSNVGQNSGGTATVVSPSTYGVQPVVITPEEPNQIRPAVIPVSASSNTNLNFVSMSAQQFLCKLTR